MNAQVIALVNQKDVVGKYTSCVNLGEAGLRSVTCFFCGKLQSSDSLTEPGSPTVEVPYNPLL